MTLPALLMAPAEPVAGAPPLPRGDRVLSIDLTLPESGDFPAAFATALDAGMQLTSFSVAWDEIEPDKGVYDPTILSIANDFYSQAGVPLTVTLNVIDTTNRRVPRYLDGKAFDDPTLIRRFKKYMRFVAKELSDVTVVALAIGNEVDGFLFGPADWAAYRAFFAKVAPLAHRLFPDVIVGVTSQFGGLIGDTGGSLGGEIAAELTALNGLTDAVFVTYYPLDSGFRVRSPSVVRHDFGELVSVYPDRLILMLEAGYPSGKGNRSSKGKQKKFVKKVFAAWDRHPEQIALISFTWLHDIPTEAVDFFLEYYGVEAPEFASFLATLGLRTASGDGRDKPAFRTLVREARRRGW